jgi:hypothetical protein
VRDGAGAVDTPLGSNRGSSSSALPCVGSVNSGSSSVPGVPGSSSAGSSTPGGRRGDSCCSCCTPTLASAGPAASALATSCGLTAGATPLSAEQQCMLPISARPRPCTRRHGGGGTSAPHARVPRCHRLRFKTRNIFSTKTTIGSVLVRIIDCKLQSGCPPARRLGRTSSEALREGHSEMVLFSSTDVRKNSNQNVPALDD